MRERASGVVDQLGLARAYAGLLGIGLVIVGLVGFLDNPIVGDPDAGPLFVTGTVHNMIFLATGFLALYIAFALVGRPQADALIGFGVLYLVIVVLTLLSPNLFGILGPSPGYNVNLPDRLLHLAIGGATIAIGVLARRALTDTGPTASA
jgi:hypothetical protein